MNKEAGIYSTHPISMTTRSLWPMMENMILPAEGERAGGIAINRRRLGALANAISYAQVLERDEVPDPSWTQLGLLLVGIEALTSTPPGGGGYEENEVALLKAEIALMGSEGHSVFSRFTQAITRAPIEDRLLVKDCLELSAQLESSYGHLTRHAVDDDAFKAWSTFSDLPSVRDDLGRARGNLFSYLLWTKLGVFSGARWSIPPPWSADLALRMLDMGILHLGEEYQLPSPGEPNHSRDYGLLYAGSSIAVKYVAEAANLSPYAVWRFAANGWGE